VSEEVGGQPTVSVVIPMYQAGPWIGETLESVESQTYPIHECIVVDDGSTDDGPEVVASIADRAQFNVRLISQTNAGVSAARNSGLAIATGDLVALLDADDLWHPKKIERQIDLMSRVGSSICLSGYAQFDSGSRRVTGVVSFRYPERAMRRWLAMEGSGLCLASSGLLRRTALDEVRAFDDRVSICEDLEFMVRICRVGPLAIDPGILVGYRNHRGQAHRQVGPLAANTAVLLDEVLEAAEFGRPFMRRCRAGLDAHVGYVHLAGGDFRAAISHLMSAARRDPRRLVTIPVNALARRLLRSLRARRFLHRWPATDSGHC
tara:strand:- start:375 stop:1334 length:960 start_codon:yes stop_codon:yes gene_type:complete